MKTLPLLSLLALLCSLGIPSAADAQTTYYLDAVNGQDDYSGTSTTVDHANRRGPWRTISRVHAQPLQPGDFVLFRRGQVWRDILVLMTSGAPDRPITIGAWPAGSSSSHPIISGADAVTGWGLSNPTRLIYSAPLPDEPAVVYFGETRGTRGPSPQTLATNEWSWASGRLYVRALLRPTNVSVATRGAAVVIAGQSFITIQELVLERTTGSGLYVDTASVATSDLVIQRVISRESRHAGLTFRNGHPTLETTHVTIRDNLVHGNGASGINISEGVSDLTITGNISHHNNWAGDLYQAGIRVWAQERTARNLVVEHNEVYANHFRSTGWESGHGIWLDEVADGAVVRYNYVHDNENHGIYLEHSSRARIHHNLVVNNRGAGIMLYRGVHDNEVAHNTVINGETGLRLSGDSLSNSVTGNRIVNNISAGVAGQRLLVGDGGENDGVRGRGNLYLRNSLGPERAGFLVWGYGVIKSTYADWERAYGSGTESIRADCRFMSSGDYRLRSNSPCRDAGRNEGLSPDMLGAPVPSGSAPDLGAYETR